MKNQGAQRGKGGASDNRKADAAVSDRQDGRGTAAPERTGAERFDAGGAEFDADYENEDGESAAEHEGELERPSGMRAAGGAPGGGRPSEGEKPSSPDSRRASKR